MRIDIYTTPEELIRDLADKLTPNDAKMLADRIEDFGEKQILRNMFKSVPEVTLSHWHLTMHDAELVDKIANHLPLKAKASLMKISYEDLLILQKQHLDEYYQLLRKVVADRYQSIYDDEDVTLDIFLQYLDNEGIRYTRKNFLDYIAKRSIPVKYLRKMKEIIDNELKEKDEEAQAPAEVEPSGLFKQEVSA